VTNGHLDIIRRAGGLFDRVIVAILRNADKRPLFSVDERAAMAREALADMPHVDIEAFDGLLAEFVRRKHAAAVVRGLRHSAEWSTESQMALMNRHLYAGCETVFLVASPDVSHISSRLVKEIAASGGSLAGLVPPNVMARLAARPSSFVSA
jgi:pantetheine-phosphate adenylyltransferase